MRGDPAPSDTRVPFGDAVPRIVEKAVGEVLRTPRLRLDELADDDADAAFVVELLNDPDFLRHIGDRDVRHIADARRYLADGPRASYARHGFGLWKATVLATGEAAGMCGLLKRDALPEADIGYAWLPRFRGNGYAAEAAAAVLAHAFGPLRLPRVLAIVSEGNVASTRLLERIGMRSLGLRQVEEKTLLVYRIDAPAR
jgi:ribosomal-protein-alanine N-acetyltransferase